MKCLLAFALIFSSQISFAGDGGYEAVSCVSGSKRTVLTFFMDNYSGSNVPYNVNFIIDGLGKNYAPEMVWDNGSYSPINCEEECMTVNYDHEAKTLSVNEGDVPALLEVQFNSNMSKATVSAGAYDPRSELGYRQTRFPNPISLECGSHYEGP